MFSALRQNSTVYILDKKGTPSLRRGQVVSVTAPRSKTNGFYSNPMDMVVDINVRTDGTQETFKNLPASLSMVNDGNVVISETREAMSSEVESMLGVSRQVMESVPYHEKAITVYEVMLRELSPQFAKEKMQEEKISALETKIGGIETSIGDMKQMLTQALNKGI